MKTSRENIETLVARIQQLERDREAATRDLAEAKQRQASLEAQLGAAQRFEPYPCPRGALAAGPRPASSKATTGTCRRRSADGDQTPSIVGKPRDCA